MEELEPFLSVPVEKTKITNLPADVMGNIRSKAERIIQTPSSICDAPGMSNAKCVASKSGGKPHVAGAEEAPL